MEVPLESLQVLHRDLIALEEGRLRNIDKLCEEIKGHVEAFKKLLDKSQKSDTSRTKLRSGMYSIAIADRSRSDHADLFSNA